MGSRSSPPHGCGSSCCTAGYFVVDHHRDPDDARVRRSAPPPATAGVEGADATLPTASRTRPGVSWCCTPGAQARALGAAEVPGAARRSRILVQWWWWTTVAADAGAWMATSPTVRCPVWARGACLQRLVGKPACWRIGVQFRLLSGRRDLCCTADGWNNDRAGGQAAAVCWWMLHLAYTVIASNG